jgi:hypothetical protein
MTRDAGVGRITPFELVFDSAVLGQRFSGITQAVKQRQADATRRDDFARLDDVARLVKELVPDDADAATLDRSLEFIYHCYHFWHADCPLYVVEEPLVRELVEVAPDLTAWQPRPPAAALYLELPRNLLWAAGTAGGPPEPVEGLFVRAGDGSEVDCLIVMGMRAGRPGFSVAGASAAVEELGELDEPGAFRSEIPGAQLAGLYSLSTPSEALTLALRILWYLDCYPESVEALDLQGTGPRGAGDLGSTSLERVLMLRLVERSRG